MDCLFLVALLTYETILHVKFFVLENFVIYDNKIFGWETKNVS